MSADDKKKNIPEGDGLAELLDAFGGYDENIDPATICCKITSGNNSATLTETTLTFTSMKTSVVSIYVWVGEIDNPTYETKITLFYEP